MASLRRQLSPPGGAEKKFSNAIFSATATDIAAVLSLLRATFGSLPSFPKSWGSDLPFWGKYPPTKNSRGGTLRFFEVPEVVWISEWRQLSGCSVHGKLLRISSQSFRENGGQKFWGRGTLAVSPTCGANLQTLYTVPFSALWAVKKVVENFPISTSGLEL